MICCEECFNDTEIKSIINSYGKKGTCDLCGISGVNIYDTDNDDYLVELFEGLLDVYIEENEIVDSSLPFITNYLKDELKNNWDIFDESKTPYMIQNIISGICRDYFINRPNLLNYKVGILKSIDEEYLDLNSIVGRYNWDVFVESIKEKYRFHTDIFRKKILKDYCKYLVRVIKTGDTFYRARISGKEGYPLKEMGAPPKDIVSSGRINPRGMSYLYLANSKMTTVHETRASLHDYICIAEFRAVTDIKVIDLTGLDKISVFFPDLDYDFHAINRGHLKRINDEIAKPVRANDSELEYLPTQYICDYIKSIPSDPGEEGAYAGIMYKSTMVLDSYNLAIFNPANFECISIEVKEINKVQYRY